MTYVITLFQTDIAKLKRELQEAKTELPKQSPQFGGFHQQDTQELLRHLTEEVQRQKSATLNHFKKMSMSFDKNQLRIAIQGDHSACPKSPVDIDLKVALNIRTLYKNTTFKSMSTGGFEQAAE